MYMWMAWLFIVALTGTESPATLPTQSMRFLTWDERAKELGRSARAESTGPLITGVNAVPLMQELLPKEDWKPREWARGRLGALTASGVDYLFVPSGNPDGAATRPGGPPQNASLRIAVYPDRDTAIVALGRGVLAVAMGPTGISDRVGDVAYVWGSPQNDTTTLLFRRDNVVASLDLPVPEQKAIELSAKLDARLAAGGPNVEKGSQVNVPQVLLPASIRVALKERRHVKLEWRGGDVAELLIETDGIIVKRSEEGKRELIYQAPMVASEAGTKNITITVATPMNVIASRQIAVEVAAAP